MYRQKMDISYCDDKTGFPRPGHIYISDDSVSHIRCATV